jgi:hypothetical protein
VNGLMDPILEYQVLELLWLYAGISLNLPRMAQWPPGKIAADKPAWRCCRDLKTAWKHLVQARSSSSSYDAGPRGAKGNPLQAQVCPSD